MRSLKILVFFKVDAAKEEFPEIEDTMRLLEEQS